MKKSLRRKFFEKVVIKKGCWDWTANRFWDGYGQILHNDKSLRAHRVSWALSHGGIPKGMHVLHRCDNPPCANPKHLFLGTRSDNMQDCAKKMRVGNQKLNPRIIRIIRREYAAGKTQASLAQKYKVVHSVVSSVVLKKTWRHVI